LIESFGDKIIAEELVRWNATKRCVEARIVEQLGGIILTEKPVPHDDDRIVSAMVEGVQLMGLETLPWNKESQSLLERSEWIRINGLVSDEWPDLSKQALMGSLEKWLGPFLSGIRQQSQLSRLNLHDILVSLFTRRQYQELETLAPHKLRLPSGSSAVIDYSSGSKPVLEVRIQEMFGQTDTPRLGSGKVPVLIHLLSPAKRPLAVTQDLRSFWQNTYPIIRKQLRAKYPKHDWPDDPLRASPTNRTKRVLKGA
jgi:ATP-dependent helicase HrpB